MVLAVQLLIALPSVATAETRFVRDPHGDHFFFLPNGTARGILVIAHGTRGKDETAQQTAKAYLNNWTDFSESHGIALIVPVFDDDRFGNTGGGYGGYRGLFGKHVPADDFVIGLVTSYQADLGLPPEPFLLYGHSAGGQFVVRFLVRHPDRVRRAVASAPGRYSYPAGLAPWPYGAGLLTRTITWSDGTMQSVDVRGALDNYAKAAGKIHVIVGSQDTAPQPQRPLHDGTNRIELAESWVAAMNDVAMRFGAAGRANLSIVPGIGHNSRALAPHAQNFILD